VSRTSSKLSVSLEVRTGEVTVLVGPSGGGKSTLLRCINGLESFQEGEVAVGDVNLTGGKPHPERELVALRRKVGMVFQQFHLFPHMTALNNIMCGPRYALGQSRAEAEPRARELLARVGLADFADARPATLSGGQQQRVAIARSLAVNPAAILFDEPTSALDPVMAGEVLAVMRDLAASGQTMIVVTHDMDLAKQATTAHRMVAGKIVQSGPPAEVLV
jgi:ABC-type polar amino acid transport system ATPase subunit